MSVNFDFFSEQFQSDPPATFARMQQECPVHRMPEGWLAVFRHEDIMAILRDNETYSARFGPGTNYSTEADAPVLVSADPPLHAKQKKAIAPAFNPRLIAEMEQPIRDFAANILDQLIAQPECDLMEALADRLPIWVVCELLDIPFADFRELRSWVDVMAGSVFQQGQAMEAERLEKLMAIFNYFGPRIEAKIVRDEAGEILGDDIISILVKGRIDGERIPTRHIQSFAQFLLVAGAATTTVLIGSFFHHMLEYPDQWEKLKANPILTASAVEEVLRFASPVHGLFRTNNIEVTLGGHEIAPDSKICLMWGSANHDPKVFENPLTFDITRDPKILRKHLSFGSGLHACIGGPLARLEARIVVEEFVKRFSGIERTGPMVPYPYPTLHGPYRLPVRLVPIDASISERSL